MCVADFDKETTNDQSVIDLSTWQNTLDVHDYCNAMSTNDSEKLLRLMLDTLQSRLPGRITWLNVNI